MLRNVHFDICMIIGFSNLNVIELLSDDVTCLADEFACTDKQECVGSSSECDGFPDCTDFSDEVNCCEYKSNTRFFLKRILNIAYEFPISGVNSFGSGGEMVLLLLNHRFLVDYIYVCKAMAVVETRLI